MSTAFSESHHQGYRDYMHGNAASIPADQTSGIEYMDGYLLAADDMAAAEQRAVCTRCIDHTRDGCANGTHSQGHYLCFGVSP